MSIFRFVFFYGKSTKKSVDFLFSSVEKNDILFRIQT